MGEDLKGRKTILFVAGGIETLPAVRRAQEMGLYTVVSDGDANAPCFRVADDHIIANTYNVDETVRKVLEYNARTHRIDGVICVASDVPVTVAEVAAALGVPGIPVSSARLAADKLAMKERFLEDDVAIPWFCAVNSSRHLEEIRRSCAFPLILKPVDSRGARGVIRLVENIESEWAYGYAKDISPTGRVMVEQYLDGPQVSTESIILDGKACTPGFADRNYSLLDRYVPFIIEDGGELPSFLEKGVQKQVHGLIQRAADSIGIRNGVVKGDVVISQGKPYIIEVAARLSGGYFCTHEIPLNTGVDFVGNAIKLAVGEAIDPRDLLPQFQRFICQRYIFPAEGVVTSISGVDEVAAREGIELCEIRIGVGQTVGKVENHPARAGLVLASGDTREEAVERAQKAVADIQIKVS